MKSRTVWREFGVLFSHEPMAALFEDLLYGLRDGCEDLVGRVRRRDLVVAAGGTKVGAVISASLDLTS